MPFDGVIPRLLDAIKASALALILIAVAFAGYCAHVSVTIGGRSGISAVEGATPVAVPERAFRPMSAPMATAPDQSAKSFNDPVPLIREVQKELKRVGCYEGRINGAWTPDTRRAMRDFTGRVNAVLPVDKPDPVLLALVKSHQEGICDVDPGLDPARSTQDPLAQTRDASLRPEGTPAAAVTGALPAAEAAARDSSAGKPPETQEARAPETAAISSPDEGRQAEAAAVPDASVEPAASQPDAFAPAVQRDRRVRRGSGKPTSPAAALSRSVTKGFKNLERTLKSIFN